MDANRLFVTFLVCGVLLTTLLVSDSGITGFVPTETISQNVNLEISSSSRYELKTNGTLSSLSLSGEVVGNGLVNIYLSNGNQEFLVFSNKRKVSSAMQHITGLSVMELKPKERLDRIDSLPEGFVTAQGAFESQCVQTCVLNGFSGSAHLDVVVDPGTTIKINKIVFSQ